MRGHTQPFVEIAFISQSTCNLVHVSKKIVRFDVTSEKFPIVSFPKVNYEGGCQSNLANVRNNIQLLVSHGFFEYSIDLWKLEDAKWEKLISVSNVVCVPLPLWCFVKYVLVDDNWLLMTDWGDICLLDLNTKELSSFYPSNYFSALKGAVYTETLIDPSI
jgi:hypothetical protein